MPLVPGAPAHQEPSVSVNYRGKNANGHIASNLRAAERIQLAEDLWDSISEAPEVLSLADAQWKELQRRLEAYRSEPDATIPWESLRQELLQG